MNNPTQESLYFEQKEIRITSSRFIVEGKTYSIANIASVEVVRIPKNILGITLMLIAGLLMMPGGISLAKDGNWILLILAIGLFGTAMFRIIKPAPYAICLSTSAGEKNAYRSNDPSFIASIFSSLNQAIDDRQ